MFGMRDGWCRTKSKAFSLGQPYLFCSSAYYACRVVLYIECAIFKRQLFHFYASFELFTPFCHFVPLVQLFLKKSSTSHFLTGEFQRSIMARLVLSSIVLSASLYALFCFACQCSVQRQNFPPIGGTSTVRQNARYAVMS